MTDLQSLLHEIDTLSADELDKVYRHVIQRRYPAYWLVPGESLKTIQEIMRPVYEQSAHLSEEEINETIDEALNEVRHERKSKARRGD